MNKKLVGVLGSDLVGKDPFDERTWSGSSKHFFEACQKAGVLSRVFGVDVPLLPKFLLIASNLALKKQTWRHKFYLDVRYYKLLTKEISKSLSLTDYSCNFIQIGGIYNVPEIVAGRSKCYSYHDGNLAVQRRSPFMPAGISANHIDRALEYERRVYLGMDKIFTMSEYLRRSFIEDFGVPPKRVICIGAGINLDELPDETDKDYGQKSILFIGINFYRKGGPVLLQAFRKLRERYRNAELHIVGPARLKIPPHLEGGVIVHGFLSKTHPAKVKQLEKLFQKCSLFVLPSSWEPFGIAALEAMVHQLPCILTDNWAFREMVTPGINGELAEYGNVDVLADKMVYLLSKPDLLRTMGQKAREKVLENYTWEVVVQKLINEISYQ